jgi:hypothetical protein
MSGDTFRLIITGCVGLAASLYLAQMAAFLRLRLAMQRLKRLAGRLAA